MRRTVLSPSAAAFLADTIARRRAQFAGWQMMADPEPGNDPTDPAEPDKAPTPEPNQPDKGYPDHTRVDDMKPEEQLAYYRAQARRHEDRNKELLGITGGRYGDSLRTFLTDAEKAIDAQRTDSERAIEQARSEARAEARGEYGTRLVAAEFRAALAHLDNDRRNQIIDGLSLDRYLTDNGEVATDKVSAFAATIAPADKGAGDRGPDYGAGRRHGGSATSGASGLAEADRRFGTTQ